MRKCCLRWSEGEKYVILEAKFDGEDINIAKDLCMLIDNIYEMKFQSERKGRR